MNEVLDPVTGLPRAVFVQREFSSIARRYELMNQIMTFGRVNWLRREAVRRLEVKAGMTVLDHGAGSGQIARLAARLEPGTRVFPSDFNLAMMRADPDRGGLAFTQSDACALPYPDGSLDRVICGFLLRNIREYPRALAEFRRVLKPGGRFVSLDTTPPPATPLRPIIRLYMRLMIPLVGALVTGRFGAYDYLVRSSEAFRPAEDLAGDLESAGFCQVGYTRLMFGAFAVHWGNVPARS